MYTLTFRVVKGFVAEKIDKDDIGVIATYRAQAELIAKQLVA
jgi:hypothetical protein